MAHGKRPGTLTRTLDPSSPICPHPGPTKESKGSCKGFTDVSEEPHGSLEEKGSSNDQLTLPVSANQYFKNPAHSPEDIDEEGACSEYDNVGSDVEQDYEGMPHVDREGTMGTRYYNKYCPEDDSYLKRTVVVGGGHGAVDQLEPRGHEVAQVYEVAQPDEEPHKSEYHLSSHPNTIAGDEVKGEVEQGLEGARLVEETDDRLPGHTSTFYQGNERDRIRKEVVGKVREEATRGTRTCEAPGARKKSGCESSHRGSKEKERQDKGRGRRGTGEDIDHIDSEIKGCKSISAEPCPKTKDYKKATTRTKPRSSSSKAHLPPPKRHNHAPVQAHSQPAQHDRETPTAPRPTTSPYSQESHSVIIKSSAASLPDPEHQKQPLEGTQSQTEELQEGLPEPLQGPWCPESVPQVDSSNNNTPKRTQETASFPCFVDVPGPCEPEDLIDGIIFAANYLGCTMVLSDKNPTKSIRMSQAQEAVNRIKAQDEDSQMVTEVDLFISTKAVKVLNADTQETMMDSALRTISYIADIGSIVVLMARRRMSPAASQDFTEASLSTGDEKSQYRMICYVFESEDAQLIAQSIGQAFSVAYREFLRANGINPKDLSQKQYSDIINSQEMYNDDLVHFSNSDNCKELCVEKQKGESLGVVIVESGWGSILPTVILANMLNTGPAARSGKLSVGDQIMSINDTSLVGLPLATCQGIIKGLKNQVKVKLSIVSCPPVTTVLIKRPDLKFQLGFSVQNGIICSLMRGGIAERGGVRVGHRIIEINGRSVVAMAHEKIVQTLSVAVGEINMKTMPAVMYRLLTGQETPIYI
ncbi:amyloid-beta A4 precursor protein-binding family A member 2 [Lampris incognitus]|uniref:amyloid-beta A4 precursor protein-binding family A member 2 n=1 Tax=Lampris incognitus TaxID=2546036 RepID=UPI0024B4A1E6|nr:amyloid-beta A4 precursor protein-binding family A member 2 [Lampris incognitus]